MIPIMERRRRKFMIIMAVKEKSIFAKIFNQMKKKTSDPHKK